MWLLIVVVLVGSGLWRASEPQACRDLDYDYSSLNAAELGLIASACRQEAMARLYYNRAYSADLVARPVSAGLSSLPDAHRLYMGMVEAFAPHWYPDERARLDFLNRQYEEATSLVELRLRQQGLLAEG